MKYTMLLSFALVASVWGADPVRVDLAGNPGMASEFLCNLSFVRPVEG